MTMSRMPRLYLWVRHDENRPHAAPSRYQRDVIAYFRPKSILFAAPDTPEERLQNAETAARYASALAFRAVRMLLCRRPPDCITVSRLPTGARKVIF